jgi:hypothetical protein
MEAGARGDVLPPHDHLHRRRELTLEAGQQLLVLVTLGATLQSLINLLLGLYEQRRQRGVEFGVIPQRLRDGFGADLVVQLRRHVQGLVYRQGHLEFPVAAFDAGGAPHPTLAAGVDTHVQRVHDQLHGHFPVHVRQGCHPCLRHLGHEHSHGYLEVEAPAACGIQAQAPQIDPHFLQVLKELLELRDRLLDRLSIPVRVERAGVLHLRVIITTPLGGR